MILTVAVLCISLFAFSSCEEDSEIFNNADIEQEKKTDENDSKKSKPGEN